MGFGAKLNYLVVAGGSFRYNARPFQALANHHV
jgi:hypothetical protein